MQHLGDYSIVDTLHQLGGSVVYRAVEKKRGEPRIIKTFLTRHASFTRVNQLKNEYQLLKDSEIEGVVKPVKLVSSEPIALIYEDIGGMSLDEWLSSQVVDIPRFFDLALPLVAALGEIHGHQIFHKDINPANIIFNPETGVIKFTDFGIASLLPRESQELRSPERLEGTLPYISPEQTGRMNRAVDYRTDFYSLGATFYQMLTGRTPFNAPDSMSMVHAHIAREPEPTTRHNIDVPIALNNIIMKLLSKDAEDRYMSAFGLKSDLERVRDMVKAQENAEFPLGEKDVPFKFNVSQKLYGREGNENALISVFERATSGTTELMLIKGYSGIGKTTLVWSVHKPIVAKRGNFISGKFDQLDRGTPYTGFIKAIDDLVLQLNGESESVLQHWRETLTAALGERGAVLTELAPELEEIIGKQPAVPELSPDATIKRIHNAFRDLFSALAKPHHPLVLFLDDLQWMDAASLSLLQYLLVHGQGMAFLVLGAYRDNEVGEHHPLMIALREVEGNGVYPHVMEMKPLEAIHLEELISDTLRVKDSSVSSLANLIYEKTGGNPFFAGRFLISLYERGLLAFSYELGRWQWRMEEIRKQGITNNVVELMTQKIGSLSEGSRRTLMIASCIGNTFDLATLSTVCEKPMETILEHIREVVVEGLVHPIAETRQLIRGGVIGDDAESFGLRFVHDRVQQAAYQMIPESSKKKIHLKIGQLLSQMKNPVVLQKMYFDIVNHLNRGESLITERNDRIDLARLNLEMARKAASSAAYSTAAEFAETGTKIIGQEGWSDSYQLCFELNKEWAQQLLQSSEMDKAVEHFHALLDHTRDPIEKAHVYRMLGHVIWTQGTQGEGTRLCRKGLEIFGMEFPDEESVILEEIAREKTLLNEKMHSKTPADLIDLPFSRDPQIEVIVELFAELYMVSAYEPQNQTLSQLAVVKGVNFILDNGNSEYSPLVLCLLGFALVVNDNDYENGPAYGAVSIEIAQKHCSKLIQIRAMFQHFIGTSHWRDHVDSGWEVYQSCRKLCLEIGESIHETWADWSAVISRSFQSPDLGEFDALLKRARALANENGMIPFNKAMRSFEIFITKLANPDAQIELDAHIKEVVDIPNITYRWVYYVIAMKFHYLLGEYDEALKMSKLEAECGFKAEGLLILTEYQFYNALLAAVRYDQLEGEEQAGCLKTMDDSLKLLKQWAEACPENFLSKYLIVEAERQRINGTPMSDMIDLYDQAIHCASRHNHISDKALASELAGKYFSAQEREHIAFAYLREAAYQYRKWGAHAKINHLRSQFASLADEFSTPNLQTSSLGSATSTSMYRGELDWNAFIRASQALSGEIKLSGLLEKLMQIVLETSGADQSTFLLKRDGKIWVMAKGHVGEAFQVDLTPRPMVESLDIPTSMINYVLHSSKSLVINDTDRTTRFTSDPYIVRHKPKSVLAAPIMHQSRLIGVVYLENSLTRDAFTTERLSVLNVLCSQAAISIENAELYGELEAHSKTLEQKVEERTRELRHKNREIMEAQELLRQKNEQILSSIEYARNIQSSILPEADKIATTVVQSFVLFEPRDRVSGDFYWACQTDHALFLAVVDCTGHGVPGAFLAMIGTTLLNQIVREEKLYDPAAILERLHGLVNESLKNTNDGMDMSLCKIERNGKVTFVGARRPLYLVTCNGREETELVEINGTRRSIGGHTKREPKPFVNHEIQVNGSHALFMTTDGFGDQVNPAGKKLGSKRLKELLCSYTHLSVDEQKRALSSYLKDYMGNVPQRDDITILGLKFLLPIPKA